MSTSSLTTVVSLTACQAVYASCFFFDVGLFMPKASITAFYWWLIPIVFRNMRFLLWITTVYIFLAAIAAVLVDVLLCVPVHYNWSLNYDEQGLSEFMGRLLGQLDTEFLGGCDTYGEPIFINLSYMLTRSTVFFIPFFIIKSLKLRQRQKFGLIAVFSLGLITMAISFGRFMIYTISNYDLGDNDGAVMCTAEMCTSLIVASLPGLKVLITRTVANHSSSRSTSGYNKSSEPHPPAPSSRIAKIATRISRPRDSVDDSEFELISVSAQNKEFGGKLATAESVDLEDEGIVVKHDFLVEHGGEKRGSYQNTTSLPFV
ncbi:hypothetical protein E4T38_07114 [Aureobasidium subglaciale]|nr:hypothetical protein E4T38_07114 [Aureobasidium subglaciale]KAI5217906.1 hypothetical protein E4T40_07193 [Aureobasidium subglaciale]KAI5221373.1 hypothetical protein E4T41_07113 [Aureobasidium subglaciale]KAI5258998.1 hypothetical protein E4T46_07022 [Aureobasidium subglaciale]